MIGYSKTFSENNTTLLADTLSLSINLEEDKEQMEEVVVTGTLKEVRRIESPVPVEVYSPIFFKKNPTPNIFEALQNVNGVRPQLNCNVCNTGDIHINGLEGPYTMVLIDGMPIVSSLSTVYGLSGIPNSLVERIEIVKGPASSLYGSEAVGGLINIITKKPSNAPAFSVDLMATSWEEFNTDIGFKLNAGKNASVLPASIILSMAISLIITMIGLQTSRCRTAFLFSRNGVSPESNSAPQPLQPDTSTNTAGAEIYVTQRRFVVATAYMVKAFIQSAGN